MGRRRKKGEREGMKRTDEEPDSSGIDWFTGSSAAGR